MRRSFVCCVLLALVTVAGAGAAPPPRAVPVAAYLVLGERVAPVQRLSPPAAVARGSLLALLRGPTAAERKAGYSSSVPSGTALRGIVVHDHVATVDLSRRFAAGGGSSSMLLRVAQVVHTLTQFPTIERVAFRIEGAPVHSIGGEGVVVAPPVDRRAFEPQAPPILVERPLPGTVVRQPISVRGTANVFEARIVVEVRSTGGTVLARRLVTATSGTGTRGSFATSLRMGAVVSRAIVVVYARSAKNGRPTDVVRVPVQMFKAPAAEPSPGL